MNSQDWLFAFLPEDEVANLCGADPVLLSSPSPSPASRFGSVLEAIAGRRTYDHRIRAMLDAHEPIHALELAASAGGHGAPLAQEVVSALESTWARLLDDTAAKRNAVRTSLARHDFRGSGLEEFVALIESELDGASMPDGRPGHPQAMGAVLRTIDRLKQLAVEADALTADLGREKEKRTIRLREAASEAARTLVESLFDPDGERRARAAELFRVIPVLVFDERLEDIASVAHGHMDAVAYAAATPRLGSRPPVVQPPIAPTSTAILALGSLSPISQSLVQRAPVTAVNVGSAVDLRNVRLEAEGLSLLRRAQAFLAFSRQAGTPALTNVLLGEGLLASADRYLFEEGNARFAQFCASDAVAAMLGAGEHYEQSLAEGAVALLLLCRLWPRLQAFERRGEVKVLELRNNLGQLMSWIGASGELEAVGQVWARERPEVAREVWNIVAPLVIDVAPLWTACALALLRQEQLLEDPEKALDKLWALLEPGTRSITLRDALQRMAREIAAADRGRISGSARNVILRELSVIELELGGMSSSSALPTGIVLDRLPAVVRSLVEAPSLSARPQIRIAKTLESVFVADRSEELRLPVVVENAANAGIARDLHVRVAFDAEDGPHVVLLEPREQALTELEPGETDERSFYCSVRRGVSGVSRVDLNVTVRSGVEVVARSSIPMAIRHDSRRDRKSPYQPGVALEADEGFVGREKQLKSIADALLSDAIRVPVIVGTRRVGKTSLLHALRRELRIGARYVTRYLSFESRPESDTSVQLLHYVAERLRELLCEALEGRDLNVVRFSVEDFRSDPYAAFERVTAAIERAAPKRGLLLFLDEFDKLLAIVERGKLRQVAGGAPLRPDEVLQPEVFGALRAMVMRGRVIRVVIAGLPKLLRLGYEERFFGMLEPVRVAGFIAEEAKSVIAFSRTTMKLTAPAELQVLRASGGQPYLLQVICHSLFNHMLDEGRDLVTKQDVADVIDRHVLPHQSYFTDFLDLIDSRNQVLVRTIARLQRDAPSRRYLSLSEIESALPAGVPTGAELRAQIDELTTEDRPLLERLPNGRVRLTIGILADYLVR